MQEFLQNIINGLALGGVYALVALGYTMVYGVLQFINFAHSDIFMLGCFGGIYLANWFSFISNPILKMIAVTIGSMLFCTLVGLTVERIAYRPLRKAPRLNVLITAIGVSLFLENSGQLIFGADPRLFPSLMEVYPVFQRENFVVNNLQIFVILTSGCLMFFLNWIVQHTKIGIAMRAVSFDIEIAGLMGIPTDRVILFTFFMGTSLAGCASMLYGLSYPKVEPMLGVMIGLKAFVAAVFGGIGNIIGAAVGGIVLGLAESFVVYFGYSSFRDAIAFAILIAILLFKPAGLFGKLRPEKV